MLVRRSLGACVLLLLACGPEGSDESSDTSGADTTTGSSSTPTTSGGGADECGPAPMPSPCTPTESSDPRVALCAMRGESDCPGPIDNGGECRWVATASFAHDALTCEAPKTHAACLAVQNYGDGCVGSACGNNDIAGDFYYRTSAECQIEVTLDSLCGYSVIGWGTCAWDTPATESCALPHPTRGPELCNCAC